MIIGFGNDLIDIRRIEKTLARFGERFTRRSFTDIERAKSDRRAVSGRNSRAATYAKRYAAKEACAKALGTGFRAVIHVTLTDEYPLAQAQVLIEAIPC